MTQIIETSAYHPLPENIKLILTEDEKLTTKWNTLTDIMRNEWICWLEHPKLQETKDKHIVRMQEDLLAGKKRPCCWPGCPHRNPKAAQYFK